VEERSAPAPQGGFLGQEPRAHVIPGLDAPVLAVDGEPVPDGVEDGLELVFLRPQVEVRGLELPDLLLDLGVEADFGALQPQEAVELGLVDVGSGGRLHQ